MKCILFLALMVYFISTVSAGTYYVDNTTSSTNWAASTNINTPCTLATSGTNAVAGDTVYLRGGTYVLPYSTDTTTYWKLGFHPENSGTSGNPITFKAYPGETPFLDNSANANRADPVGSYGTHFQDYIVYDGLNTKSAMSNGLSRGAVLHQTTGSIIQNADIQAADGAGSNNAAVRIEDSDNSYIQNCVLHGAHQAGGAQHNSAAFLLYDSNNIILQNCTIYDSDCAIFDKTGGTYNTYRYNLIYDCYWGFQHSSRVGPVTGNLDIYQNVWINLSSWAFENSGGDAEPANDIYFFNNVIYNSNGVKISSQNDAYTDVTEFKNYNNILYVVGTGTRAEPEEVNIIDYNNYYTVTNYIWDETTYTSLSTWQTASSNDTYSITSNPNFVNVGGSNAHDYKLQSGSPALTLGKDLQDYDDDGNTTETIPSGAYITGYEVIGYTEGSSAPVRSSGAQTGSQSAGTTELNISLTTDINAPEDYTPIIIAGGIIVIGIGAGIYYNKKTNMLNKNK